MASRTKRMSIIQPTDWIDACQAEADKTHSGNLSAWLWDAAKASLPKRVASGLKPRPAPHRPKKIKEND